MSSSAASSGPAGPVIASRPALIGAAVLLGGVLAAAIMGQGKAVSPPPGAVQDQRALLFADRADGAVVVTDAASRRLVAVATGQQGFLRQTMRGLTLARDAAGLDRAVPFTLTYYADRRLILRDPADGRQVELEAFGPDNEAVFARLLAPEAGGGRVVAAASVPRG